jgi:hypothetical protein
MKKIIAFSLLSAILATACTKETTQVQQVNQAFSATYSVAPSDWTTPDNGISYNVSFEVPEVDDNVYSNGAVLVYLSFGTDYYEALPEVFEGIAYGFIHSSGFVTVDISAVDGGSIQPPTQSASVKIVLIKAQALMLHQGINLRDYANVKQAFGLK